MKFLCLFFAFVPCPKQEMFCPGSQPYGFLKNQCPACRIVYWRALPETPTMQHLYVSLARQFADIGTYGAYFAPLCTAMLCNVTRVCLAKETTNCAWCSDILTSTHRYVTAGHGFSKNPSCLRQDRTFSVSDIRTGIRTSREISWQIVAMGQITKNYLNSGFSRSDDCKKWSPEVKWIMAHFKNM